MNGNLNTRTTTVFGAPLGVGDVLRWARPLRSRALLTAAIVWAGLGLAAGQPFRLPTLNRFLFDKGSEEKFFVPTPGKPWTSGCYGCVRTEGWQMHEGIDIRSLQHDSRGEPTDLVMATADGTVVYINAKPSLSNYGIYVILRHRVEGLEVYSLYAHLRSVREGLKSGQGVRTGDVIGVMGRTANTGEAISKERAHVHFELNLLINDRFEAWHKKAFADQRNDHGVWNGQNLVGLDPRLLFLAERDQGPKFSLLGFVRGQTELCRVMVRKPSFPWVQRYRPLVRSNPVANREGIAGYELALNFAGLPYEVIPRAASEIKGKTAFRLLSVNEAEYRRNPCRKLVTNRTRKWELANNGTRLLELLTF